MMEPDGKIPRMLVDSSLPVARYLLDVITLAFFHVLHYVPAI